jgi:hypothetical protein
VGSNGNIVPKKEYKHWFIGEGKQHLALNYSIRILPKSQIESHIIDLCKYDRNAPDKIKRNRNGEKVPMPFPTFFAALGGECKEFDKQFSITDILKIKFLLMNSDLKKAIEEHFAYFLATTNFGTRQSKGFGSFYLDSSDEHFIPIDELFNTKEHKREYWSFSVITNENIKSKVNDYYPDYGEAYSLFSEIELLYKTLRSGLNLLDRDGETRFYFKSLLHKYMTSIDAYDTWDKAVLKAAFIDGIRPNDEDRVLSRDMLGLSTIHEYRNIGSVRNFTARHPSRKTDDQSRYPENDVKRFKSPILFKPVKVSGNTNKYQVFILYDTSNYRHIQGEEVLFLQVRNRIEDTVTIRLPDEFDLRSFLLDAFSVDLKQHVENHQKRNSRYDYLEQGEYEQLERIFGSLVHGGAS